MSDLTVTAKIKNLREEVEVQVSELTAAYEKALKIMLASPTEENIKAFTNANNSLWEAQYNKRHLSQTIITREASKIMARGKKRSDIWVKRFFLR